MASKAKLVFWTFVLTLGRMDSSSGQRLGSSTDTCNVQTELDELQQIVKNQAITIEILKEEIGCIKKLYKSCSISEAIYGNNGGILSSSSPKMSLTTLTSKSTLRSPEVQPSIGSRGREFLILFMRSNIVLKPSSIYITTDKKTTVDISTSPNLDVNMKSAIDKNVEVISNSKFFIPLNLTCKYFKIEPKAILLKSSELSTVTIFDSFRKLSNDGTLVIPTDKLSTKYLVSVAEPHYPAIYYYCQFAIAALHDRTSINIKFKIKGNVQMSLLGGTYGDGDVFSLTLKRLETFQIGHTKDLTGTLIMSTKPIAVFSGNRCHTFKAGCSHMLTQLPPTKEFDTQYIVPSFYNNAGTFIQVMSENHTVIKCSIRSNVSKWNLNVNDFKNFEVTLNETTILVSDSPVLVSAFGMGRPHHPYMTVIPGLHQYISYYKVFVPYRYTEDFISVIIPQTSANNIRINGKTSEHYRTVYQTYVVLTNTFSIRTFEVHGGSFVLLTTDNSSFGVIVYGHRSGDGYGFPGNFVLV